MFVLANRFICLTSGFLYPIYASYKAIKTSDAEQLERWLMYWSVAGVITVAEMTVEWMVNWFPLYNEAKTLVILWLTLPQIQGSSFVYLKYLHPFLQEHENDIDTAVAHAKANARKAGLDYLKRFWAAVKDIILSGATDEVPAVQNVERQPQTQPKEQDTSYQAWGLAASLLRQYGQPALAAGHAVMHPMQSESAPARSDKRTRTSSTAAHQQTASSSRVSSMSRGELSHRRSDSANEGSASSDNLRLINPLARRSASSSNLADQETTPYLAGSFYQVQRNDLDVPSLPPTPSRSSSSESAGRKLTKEQPTTPSRGWFIWSTPAKANKPASVSTRSKDD